jgi:YD repeat-containing protein
MRIHATLMSVFPIVLDSRPDYLRGPGASVSLLMMPVGTTTVMSTLASAIAPLAGTTPTVLPLFEPPARYAAAIAEAAGGSVGITTPADYLAHHEPSDWIWFIDPRWWAAAPAGLDALLADARETGVAAHHLCVLERSHAGTRERVEYDARGRVQRIRRYYADSTWAVGAGVHCSMVPAACLQAAPPFTWTSLAELRTRLSDRGVPTRDSVLRVDWFNLDLAADLLRINERAVRDSGGHVDPRASISPAARLVGPVIVHEHACVEAGATVVGPAVIGAGAHVGQDVTLAQCIVAPRARIPRKLAARHRTLAGDGAAVTSAGDREPGATRWRHPAAGLTPVAPARGRLYPDAVKLVFDTAFALLAVVATAPLMLVIAGLIRIDSRGPVLYADIREGKGGRPFRCFKFRTMAVGAAARQRELYATNEMDGPQFKLARDPRVTRVGRWLRATSLDELPQFFNVLLGQMSVVGPRPSPFRENQVCVPWRIARLSVKPGITGLWQVCRRDRALGDFDQWIYYDLLYVREASFATDVRILLATILTLGGHWPVPLPRIVASRTLEGAA